MHIALLARHFGFRTTAAFPKLAFLCEMLLLVFLRDGHRTIVAFPKLAFFQMFVFLFGRDNRPAPLTSPYFAVYKMFVLVFSRDVRLQTSRRLPQPCIPLPNAHPVAHKGSWVLNSGYISKTCILLHAYLVDGKA